MKKILLLGLILITAIMSAACTIDIGNVIDTLGGDQEVGSKKLVTKKYDFEKFKKIESSNTFRVIIEQSDTYSLEIETDDNIVEFLDVREDGDKLILALESGKRYNNVTLIARISVPDLTAIYTSGASDVELTNGLELKHDFEVELSGASSFEGDMLVEKLDISLSGASDISGKIDSKSMIIDISGASSIRSSGNTNSIIADISGASDINMYELTAKTLKIDLSGASSAEVSVSNAIDVKASGASTLKYKGDVKVINKDLSGSSDLVNKN